MEPVALPPALLSELEWRRETRATCGLILGLDQQTNMSDQYVRRGSCDLTLVERCDEFLAYPLDAWVAQGAVSLVKRRTRKSSSTPTRIALGPPAGVKRLMARGGAFQPWSSGTRRFCSIASQARKSGCNAIPRPA